MWVSLLVPTLLFVVAVQEPAPRWRAAYFQSPRLEGAPVQKRERDIDHEWRSGSPLTESSSAPFSARWDSCLLIEDQKTVAFQLTSSAGARLLIDGTVLIDEWEASARRTRGLETRLAAGAHHVRVEYTGSPPAAVTLAASFDGLRPKRIPPEMLRLPEEDSRWPCGETRSAPNGG